MYNIIQHSHSGFMWLAVILLVLSVLFSLLRFVKKNETPSAGISKLYLFTKWLLYIQFILGTVLLFISEKVSYASGFMKNSDLRFTGIEHPLMMIIAVGLVSIGLYSSKKKSTEVKKNKTVFIYYTIALLIILYMVPWKTVLS